jgi:hypothetical protein
MTATTCGAELPPDLHEFVNHQNRDPFTVEPCHGIPGHEGDHASLTTGGMVLSWDLVTAVDPDRSVDLGAAE